MKTCSFKTKYFDYEKKEPVLFECREEAKNSKNCIFHDKKTIDEDKLIEAFNEKIKNYDKKEPLFLIGYTIPKLNLKMSFSKPVYFTRSKIKNAIFSNSNFINVDFSGSDLINLDFSNCTFNEADFLAVKFSGTTKFSNCKFKEKVNFSESFFENVDFSESYLNNAQFIGTKLRIFDFGLCEISNSDFFGVVFEGQGSFIGSKINKTRFPNAKFNGLVNFTGAKITKTNFPQCKFNDVFFDQIEYNVGFLQQCVFLGNANFSNSKLNKVDLFKTEFKKNCNFTECNLHEVIFSNTNFLGDTKFIKTTFEEKSKFKNSEFQKVDFSLAKFNGKTEFSNVNFNIQNKTNFDVEDLSKVSFLNTNITNIQIGEKVRWAGQNGFRIIDDNEIDGSLDKNLLESVLATYRMLRKNYEKRYRFEEADKFFKRQIELQKKYTLEGLEIPISKLEILEKKIIELKEELEKLTTKIEQKVKEDELPPK